MRAHQQKIFIKKRFKSQRQYLIPLNDPNPIEAHIKESNQPIIQTAPNRRTQLIREKNYYLGSESSQKRSHSSFKDNRTRLPRLNAKRSISVNLSQRIRIFTEQKSMPRRKQATSIPTQPRQESLWEDLDSQADPISVVYEPLLGRRHLNAASAISHSSETITADKGLDSSKEGQTAYYKHPLQEKLIRRQDIQTPKFIAKIKNQSSILARLRFKALNLQKNKKAFLKIGNAILFIAYLRRYNRLYRGLRQKYMFELSIDNLKRQISKFRECLWIQLSDFTSLVFEKRQVNFSITDKDSSTLIHKKRNYLNIFIQSLIKCLEKAFQQLQGTKLMEIIYHLCKHGSYSCSQNLLSEEQLDLLCLSETEGYIRCHQFLEKSSVITLLLVKIVLYSTLLKPHTLSKQESINSEYFENNIKLIVTRIQKTYIHNSKKIYEIGNWRKLRQRFIIKPTTSMTIKEGVSDKKELISGLIKQTIISEAYQTSQWSEFSSRLQRILDSLHNEISQFHIKFRRQCF